MPHFNLGDEIPVRGKDCNIPEISLIQKSQLQFFSKITMYGEVSYRKPTLVAQVAPNLVNYIFAFN
jgi:hypothetical protein